MWITSVDERVCPICGPLHGVVVPLTAQFDGGFDGPPAHPRCRCDIAPAEIIDAGDTMAEYVEGGGFVERQPAAGVVVTVPTFATVQEAEAWARDNLLNPKTVEQNERWNARPNVKPTKYISFRGLSEDAISDLLSTIKTGQDVYGVPKLDGIVATNTKKTWMMSTRHRTLYINTRYAKNSKMVADFAAKEIETLNNIRGVLPSLEAAAARGGLPSKLANQLRIAQEMNEYKRLSMTQTFSDTVTHELGHVADSNASTRSITRAAAEDMLKSGKIKDLSYYPMSFDVRVVQGHTLAEIYAESFVAYTNGERLGSLTQSMIDAIEKVIANG